MVALAEGNAEAALAAGAVIAAEELVGGGGGGLEVGVHADGDGV